MQFHNNGYSSPWLLAAGCLLALTACHHAQESLGPEPVIHQFTAEPQVVEMGEAAALTLRYDHGTARVEPRVGQPEGPEPMLVYPETTTEYTLMVTSPEHYPVSAKATVTVKPGLRVTVLGQPAGAGKVTITGPGGFSRTLEGPGPLTGLAPGAYVIKAEPVVVAGRTWKPVPAARTVQVTTGTSVLVLFKAQD